MSYVCPNCGSKRTRYTGHTIEAPEVHDRRTYLPQHRCWECWASFVIHEDGRKVITSFSLESRPTEEILAENLLISVQWHKEKCHDKDCGVSTFLLGEAYERLLGRERTKEELEVFW